MGWIANLVLILLLSISPLASAEEEKLEGVPPVPEEIAIVPEIEKIAAPPILLEEIASLDEIAAGSKLSKAKRGAAQEGYTINYNTVSILEYIRFASKICKVNFIYEEADLNFTVTVVSDEPITAKNVMATLIQVLRIHGLMLLEQDNNLVIHRSTDVKQVATLVTENQTDGTAAIVTRIFRVKNAKPDSIAAIIRPMISTQALLEVSMETRQLILSDITANVDKVATLIENLDSPFALLDIKSYDVQHLGTGSLVDLASQIMNPIALGNPFLLVPQEMANKIFVVSTPELTDKAISVLTSLDTPPKKEVANERRLKSENIFVYKVMNRSGDDVLKGLNNIAKNLQQTGVPDPDLVDTIEHARWIAETNSIMMVGSKESLDQIKDFLAALDVSSVGPGERVSFFIYKPQNRSAQEVQSAITEMVRNLKEAKGADQNLIDTIESVKVNPLTHTLVFSGEEKTFPQIKDLLATIDAANGKFRGKNNFFLYKIQKASEENIASSLKDFAKTLSKSNVADEGLNDSIANMKYIKETNSLLFTGPDAALKKIQDIVPGFDTGMVQIPASTQFFIYKPVYKKGDQLLSSIKEITEQLKSDKLSDPALIHALESGKWVKSTNSFMFTGDPEALAKIQTLIGSLDVATGPPTKPGAVKNFFIYQPQYASREVTDAYLKQVADNLNKKSDGDLIDTLRSMKWIEPSRSFMFNGTEDSLARIRDILKTFDTPDKGHASQKAFTIYPLQYASQEKAEQYLNLLADNLSKKGGNEDLVASIRSYKWVPETHSFMFNGSDAALTQVKDLMKSFDDTQQKKPGYFIYKVQNTTGDVIEDDLDSFAKNFKSSGLKDIGIVDVIDKMRYVKETNSLLLTGNPQAIDEVKTLIAQYDYPRAAGPAKSNFFMYKPLHLKAAQIEKSLHDVGNNLKKADLADPALLQAIDTMKYVETTNSIVFTGPPDTLIKIQSLVKDIDVAPEKVGPIQHVGKTTFLLYKLKYAGGTQIVNSIKTMTTNLKKSGTSDKDFLSALNSMKYVKDTNSLLFTGTEEALTKVQTLVEQFDVTGLGPKVEAGAGTASNFFVYKPIALTGPELEKIMQDFAENLKSSGLNDPDLFNSITSMRWIDKTQSIVFTGTPKALDQIKELLKTFDIPTNLPEGPALGAEGSIQAIDNTSFLVYKLQFHKGDEIQGALRQIAKDLILSNAPVNQNLLNAINSIQWLEVTNSLLCSGDQETLTRLRELIKNLDIPLKQVFIEMLVIQTNMTNALTFGLEWGANYKYRNKFSGNSYNLIPAPPGTTSVPTDPFATNLSNIGPTGSGATSNTPTPQLIPPPIGSGFDLGVIGEVIRHNGQTFLSLGSLIQALQTDDESSVVMTPKIITQDGRTSTIFVGENIPFAGSFVSNTNGGGTLSTSNIEYRDIGFNLTITPVLGNSDIVTLDISLDRSQTLTNITQASLNPTQTTANGIVTSKTTMETTVHVPDNHYLILSGMVNNSNVKTKAGIPCLGGLPVIGAAFSKSGDTLSNSNIVIFIRPHIINSLDDMKHITAHEEDYFRDQAGTPFLERNYDESMELIKTVDDE
ncbi:MAG TPA: secretin N-terminal domain-containing protein [Chlamydiales bacterium]|nr:secretin N-terminal domain-containing protein [Chlamydiales bacterium]